MTQRFDARIFNNQFRVLDSVTMAWVPGEPFRSRMEADIAAERLNRASRVRASIYGAIDTFLESTKDRPQLPTAMHLAGSMADLGAIAGALHGGAPPAELERTITELAGRLVWWLEDIERTR